MFEDEEGETAEQQAPIATTAATAAEDEQPSSSSSASQPLPRSNKAYGKKEYWDDRFEQEEAFEWLVSFEDVREKLLPLLSPKNKDSRILLVGCGNSNFSSDLYDAGYPKITSLDYSPIVIENMQQKNAEFRPDMKWVVMDMTDMSELEDASFDVVIDKAAMDALMVDEGDVWNPDPVVVEKARRMCRHISRILIPNTGLHLHISFAQQHFRKKYLLGWHSEGSPELLASNYSDEFGWSVECQSILGDGNGCFHHFMYIMKKEPKTNNAEDHSPTQPSVSENQAELPQKAGVCCFFLKYGVCEPPRPPCRFRHEPDDGIIPCCFGATCRLGHTQRVQVGDNDAEKLAYWRAYNRDDGLVGESPAVRDATLLRSQLEPWPTSVLRERLANSFGEDHRDLDPLARGELMRRLLEHYKGHGPRKLVEIPGSKPIDDELREQLLEELKTWRRNNKNGNTRPSINAKSYMILRTPMEFKLKDSKKAATAAKKLVQHARLWELAKLAISKVDPEFGDNFSALAVTYGFTGSPHIDKQNTGPFYGLSLGSFPEEQGGICVEVDAFSVAHVHTKNCLQKVDGRFPHWVAPYDSDTERYSLIYYTTWQQYEQPITAVFT